MTGSDRIRYITSREGVPAEHRHHYHAIAESRGGVRGPFPVLLNSPELAGRVGHLGAYVRFEGELSDADRELAILTTARTFDCAYEWAAHVPIAREAGVREEAIRVVAESGPTDALEAGERAVVEYGRELFEEHSISEGTFGVAVDRFGESGITELTGTMGYYAMVASVLNAFEVSPEPDAPELP
jgi:4-carboxymuconolactone decarboxylase